MLSGLKNTLTKRDSEDFSEEEIVNSKRDLSDNLDRKVQTSQVKEDNQDDFVEDKGVLETQEQEEEMSSNNEEMKYHIFDGNGYEIWKMRLLINLEFKDCKEQAVRKREDTDTIKAEDWAKLEKKAKMIIVNSVSNDQLEYIGECQTAYDMLQKFDSMYINKSTALQIICRSNLDNIRMKDYESVEEFFIAFEQGCNKIKAAGGTINEEEKIRYLLKALPTNYSFIGDYIDLVPADQKTFEFVKTKIVEKSLSKKDNDKKKNVSTFNTKTKGVCYNCGKPGHLKKDCWSSSQQSQGRGHQTQRGRAAHHNQGRGRGSQRGNSRGGRGAGSGRGAPPQRGGATTGHEQNNDMASWVTQLDHQQKANIKVKFVNKVDCKKVGNNNFEINFENKHEVNWLLDSGCTDHLINNDEFFENVINLKKPIDVNLPDGKKLKATKLGKMRVHFENYDISNQVELKNVYYVPGLRENLLSTSKIAASSTIVTKGLNAKIYNNNRDLVAVAVLDNGLYRMKSFIYNMKKEGIYANITKLTEKERWHRALGHVNFQYLDKLVRDKLLTGLPEKLESNEMKCANCIQSKMANVPFENDRTGSTEILELIHTDLNGPHRIAGYGGERYFLTFIDDFSRCSKIFCINSKAQTASCFVEYVNLVENQFDKRVKKLQCDNGKEYLNRDIYNFIKYKGIELLPCPPYVHELNGVAERFNRSAMDIGRCLLREAKVHKRYWPEIIKTVSYLKNRTLANTTENKTPYEILTGKKPDARNLKIYGSKVFVRTPEVKRHDKWDDKSNMGTLIGYNNNSYRVLLNNKIVNARHVKVIENECELICLEKVDYEDPFNVESDSEGTEKDDNYSDKDSGRIENISDEECDKQSDHDNDDEGNIIDDVNVNNRKDNFENDDNQNEIDSEYSNENNLEVKRRPNRKKSPIVRYGNPISHFIYVNYVQANAPNNFEEAINSPEGRKWQIAMDREIESLNKNNTWKIVDKPFDKKIIDVKWIYKRKNDNTYKARLVARGFQQKDFIEDVYSPVGKMQTLKILLSYSCYNNNVY